MSRRADPVERAATGFLANVHMTNQGDAMSRASDASEDWAAIGTIAGAFGLHGDLKVQPLTDFPERFEHTSTVYVGTARAARRVTSARLHGRLVILHLEGIETATDAAKLRGQQLAIPAGELVALPRDSYYLHDLIGLRVLHVDGTPLGAVADVITGGGNDLFVVRTPQGGEVLLPAVKEFVRSVDLADGVIRIAPIPGLFDDQVVVADENSTETSRAAGPDE
jgi:16S rRNA processing protein RimM